MGIPNTTGGALVRMKVGWEKQEQEETERVRAEWVRKMEGAELFIGRHTVCDRDRTVDDTMRQITEGGYLLAQALGNKLKELGFKPDTFVGSPALRTKQTLLAAFGEDVTVISDPNLSTHANKWWRSEDKMRGKEIGYLIEEATVYVGNAPIATAKVTRTQQLALERFVHDNQHSICRHLRNGAKPAIVGHAVMVCHIAEGLLYSMGWNTDKNLAVVRKVALEPGEGFLFSDKKVTLVTP